MTYKNIILDDSILDIDSWLPETAIDEIIAVLNEMEDDQTYRPHSKKQWTTSVVRCHLLVESRNQFLEQMKPPHLNQIAPHQYVQNV